MTASTDGWETQTLLDDDLDKATALDKGVLDSVISREFNYHTSDSSLVFKSGESVVRMCHIFPNTYR
jgi:hypothetical protein